MRIIEHWIAGKTTAGAAVRTAPVYNPATGQQSAEVALGSRGDVEAGIAAARVPFPAWSQPSVSRLSKVLFAFRELVNQAARQIAESITDEHGKVLIDAR